MPRHARISKTLTLAALTLATLLIGLNGSAAAASALTVSPDTFDFGAKNIGGEASFPGEFTVTNESDEAVTVGRPEIQPRTNFLIPPSWDECWGEVLQPGETCPVAVMFEPEEEGNVIADLVIDSSAPGADPVAALEGLAYPRLLPAARTIPSSTDFGNHVVGTTSTVRTIELVNQGLGDLVIEAAAIGGRNAPDFRIETDRCRNRQIASGMSCRIDVVFSPQAAGARQARLVIPTDDLAADTFVELAGTGAGVVPEPLDGRAKVRIGSTPSTITKRKLKTPITCKTKGMDLCSGRIKVYARNGTLLLARGTFSVPAGKWFATLYLRFGTDSYLRSRSSSNARFEVTTTQESGENRTRSFKRVIRHR